MVQLAIKLIDVPTAAKILHMTPNSVYAYANEGKLTKYVIGVRNVRVDETEVRALIVATPKVRPVETAISVDELPDALADLARTLDGAVITQVEAPTARVEPGMTAQELFDVAGIIVRPTPALIPSRAVQPAAVDEDPECLAILAEHHDSRDSRWADEQARRQAFDDDTKVQFVRACVLAVEWIEQGLITEKSALRALRCGPAKLHEMAGK